MRSLVTLAVVLVLAGVPPPVCADSTSDVIAAGRNFAALRSWHADEAFEDKTIRIDYAAPDRFRLQMPTGTQTVIGASMYMSVGGRTLKFNMPAVGAMVAQLKSPVATTTFFKSHAVADRGPSSVGGVPTHAYAFDDTTQGFTTHNVLDIGPQQLPYRMVVNSERGKVTITYSRFNIPVTIKPPA